MRLRATQSLTDGELFNAAGVPVAAGMLYPVT